MIQASKIIRTGLALPGLIGAGKRIIGVNFATTGLIGAGKYIPQSYTSLALMKSQVKLNPYWVSGLIDAECSFVISIQINKKYNTGWKVQAIFSISPS